MENKFQDELIQKIFLFIGQNELWPHTISIGVIILIGYIAVWYISAHIAYKKTTAEIVRIRIENIDKLHNKDAIYQDNQIVLNLQISSLVDLLQQQSSPDEVNKIREEIIHHIAEKLFVSLDRYIDFFREIKTPKECRIFFKEHILPLLETIFDTQQILNSSAILEKINRTPFNLSKKTFYGLRHFKDIYFSYARIPTQVKYLCIIKKLTKNEQRQN